MLSQAERQKTAMEDTQVCEAGAGGGDRWRMDRRNQ